jgi:S1-C subfamily serine protease
MASWCVAAMLLTLAAGPALAAGRGWLGVTTQSTDEDLRRGLDLTRDGLLVNQVSEDSPAERAGLKKGDVILTFNSRTVTRPEDLRQLVRDTEPGRNVSLGIWRDGARRTLQLKVGELPMADDQGDDSIAPPAPPDAPSPPDAPRARRAPRASSDSDRDRIHRRIIIDGREVPEDQIDDQLKDLHGQLDGMMDLKGLKDLKTMRNWSGPGGSMMFVPSTMGRGRLGVRIEKLNSDLADALGVDGDKGVLVTEVLEDTPAQKAGVRAGDVIMSVGGESVDSPEQLVRMIESRDGKVDITVQRKGVRRDLHATLDDRKSADSTSPEWQGRGDGRGLSRNREPGAGGQGYRGMTKDDGGDASDLREELRQLKQELQELRDQMREKKEQKKQDGN